MADILKYSILLMPYHGLSVFFFFLTIMFLADFVTPLEPWDDMKVKHTWHAIPVNWEILGHPLAGTRIKLHIALRPERESALIDAVSEISNPRHPRHVLLTTPPLAPLFTCTASPFQIWRIPFRGASC
jgi:hypothetical protein